MNLRFLANYRLAKRRPSESDTVRALTTLTLAMRNDPELRRTTREKIADAIYGYMATHSPRYDSDRAADAVMSTLFSVGPD
jgi:hypothetical protein